MLILATATYLGKYATTKLEPLSISETVFPKQLDELYPMHTPTASAEGVGIDNARAAHAKLLVG